MRKLLIVVLLGSIVFLGVNQKVDSQTINVFLEKDLIEDLSGGIRFDTAEFNGDEYVDLVVAYDDSNGSVWFENNGDMTFTKKTSISNLTDSSSIVYTIDLDNDGLEDIVEGSFTNSTLKWYKNNGNGTFTNKPVIDASMSAQYIESADLNNDTYQDLLVTDINSNTAIWYENNGDDTFTSHSLTISGTAGYSITAGFVDNDNLLDIVIGFNNTSEIYWYKNNGNDTFTEQTVVTNSATDIFDLKLLDVDNDTYLDIVSANAGTSEIGYYKNDGSGSFTTQPAVASGLGYISDMDAVDVNKDGYLDIVVSSMDTGELKYIMNNKDGSFKEESPILENGVFAVYFQSEDLDTDGDSDFAIIDMGKMQIRLVENMLFGQEFNIDFEENGGSTINSYELRNSVEMSSHIIDTESDIYNDGKVARINNDTNPDLISYSSFDIKYYTGDSSGEMTLKQTISDIVVSAVPTNFFNMSEITLMDYNDDGYEDIYARVQYEFSATGNVIVVFTYDSVNDEFNDGEILFQDNTLSNSSKVRIVDIDNDSDNDLVYSSGDSLYYSKKGVAAYDTPTLLHDDYSYISKLEVDFVDGSSYPEIIVFDTDTIYYYTNSLGTSFSRNQLYVDATHFSIIDIDNNDDDLDILLTYSNSGYTFTSIYRSLFEYSFNVPYSTYQDGYTEDLNRDGHNDLLIQSNTNAYIFYGNGSSLDIQFETIPKPVGVSVKILGVTDLFNDGDYDVYFSLSNSHISYSDSTIIRVLEEPSAPTKTNQDFNGWYTDAQLTNEYDFSSEVTEDFTLYAKWMTSLTFNENGGTSMTDLYEVPGSTIAVQAAPTKENYTFIGWYTESELINEYTLTSVMPSGHTELYAKWAIDQYTVEYVDYDGTVLQTAVYDYDSDLSGITAPSIPDREGYTFDAWDTVIPNTMPANDVTITATYTINNYTIEYVDYDGSMLQTTTYDFQSDLSAVTAPNIPSREGYTFDAWDISVPSTMPANNITITATYIINSYTVTYNVDGIVTTEIVEYGGVLTNIPNPTKQGYTFVEWQMNIVPVNLSSYTQGVGDVTFIAIFVDSEPPVISGDTVIEVKLSEVDNFVVPQVIVTDNEDMNSSITITMYDSNMTSVLTELSDAQEKLNNEEGIYIVYIAIDSEGNVSDEYTIEIVLVDDVAPIIKGVVDSEAYERGSELVITFDEGTATINGELFQSGDTLSGRGIYNLVVIDEANNVSTVTFAIEGFNWWWLLLLLLIPIIGGTIYYFLRFETEKEKGRKI